MTTRKQRRRERSQRKARNREARAATPNLPAVATTTSVAVTNGFRVDPSRTWIVLRMRPNWGPRFRRETEQLGIPTFVPRVRLVVTRRGRRRLRSLVLVNRIVFVGAKNREEIAAVRSHPGVWSILSVEGAHVVVKPEDLQAFADEIAKEDVSSIGGIGIGQHVLVVEGPFASFQGTVREVLPNDRARIEISIFGRPSLVTLGAAQFDEDSTMLKSKRVDETQKIGL